MTKKKHFKSFKEFLEDKKKTDTKDKTKSVNWDERKEKWINSVEHLYKLVDEIIVSNFEEAGFEIQKKKKEIQITEDYLGTYNLSRYYLKANNIEITFNPIGSIILGAYGRVDMILSFDTFKLIMPEWNVWKIVKGFGGARNLVDFNVENVNVLFQENL